MEKIRINKDDVYRIEVNDNGDCIEFDLLDIELPMKVINLSKEIEKQTDFYNKKSLAIYKQYKDNQELLYTNKNKCDVDFCNRMRKEFDKLLGENACQKIFGNINRVGMFDDLFEQLMPHFEKIKVDMEKVKDKLVEKYSLEDKRKI